jgi:hypothetical protein
MVKAAFRRHYTCTRSGLYEQGCDASCIILVQKFTCVTSCSLKSCFSSVSRCFLPFYRYVFVFNFLSVSSAFLLLEDAVFIFITFPTDDMTLLALFGTTCPFRLKQGNELETSPWIGRSLCPPWTLHKWFEKSNAVIGQKQMHVSDKHFVFEYF